MKCCFEVPAKRPDSGPFVQADGNRMDNGEEYLRDVHGGVSNLGMETVAMLLGIDLPAGVGWRDGFKVLGRPILMNKCWKKVGTNIAGRGLAVYNKDGNYRMILLKK